ncbi:segregation/condensation protein A [Halostella sp. JP-L12]|uniref:segregation/condensation protein A n=1 Tax=Halostella TaxID=1843185 RepID=UPI000EF7C671|nr:MULTISPECIES: ScpA family protein [Halostella]NHN47520.1 segregation/condensation protein A [Halostella sp. JP-L12]
MTEGSEDNEDGANAESAHEERDDRGSAESDGGIPLDIAGHEDRDPPGTDEDAVPGGSTNGDDPAAVEDLVPEEETDEDEVEPVELLVQLAKEGEIDPWDIDIVAVTDKFLDRLDEVDLRTSGRALFYASVLLRMKGDGLLSEDEPEEDDEPAPWEAPFDDGAQAPPPDHDPVEGLEREMERRLERKQARGTPETLDELVRELREAERESWWKESRSYDTSDSPGGFQRGTQTLDYRSGDDMRVDDEPTQDEVTSNTHEEDIETVIEDVFATLSDHYDAGRDEVLYAEIEDAGGSKVQTFLALLFLSNRGRVRLQQDELFGDLWVQDPGAATGSDEAIAD